MTGMLASVNSLDEARLLLSVGVDILDLKDPGKGSLGALPKAVVAEIVETVKGRCLISCTIGDLPMQPDLVYATTLEMAETGVDYVKVGIFPDGDSLQVLEKLATLSPHYRLIVVLFADAGPHVGLIDLIHGFGFSGIMLDTMEKAQGSLCQVFPWPDIEHFVGYAKSKQLLCGLAGSLSLEDIPRLLGLKPDYLGFRSALCDQGDRRNRINPRAAERIRQAVAKPC